MIKPRTTFVLYIIVLILVYIFLPWKGIIFILISSLFLLHLVYCSAKVCSQAYIKTLCKANISDKKITITFDDGPHREITPQVLQILEKYNIKATFFCIGKQIEQNPEILKTISQKGHLIGNHTWSHNTWFDLYNHSKMETDINKTNILISEIINKTPKLFRPPYGVTNPALKKAVKKFNFNTIGWSIRSLDTIYQEKKLFNRLKNIQPGDIILFHDNRQNILEVLEKFIKFVKNEGYQIVNLDDLLNIKAYA